MVHVSKISILLFSWTIPLIIPNNKCSIFDLKKHLLYQETNNTSITLTTLTLMCANYYNDNTAINKELHGCTA